MFKRLMPLKIVLCHFCEAHGPRVLFCTETKTEAQLKGSSASKSNSTIQGGAMCSACTSVSDHLGFVSKEETFDAEDEFSSNQNVVYKSSQYPESADDFSQVRQACVKSLSNEVRG